MAEEKKNIPKLRFREFTGDNANAWEQRKLGEVFSILKNNTLSRANLSDEHGAAQDIHYGDILTKFNETLDISTTAVPYIQNEEVIEKTKATLLKNGDIVLADTAEDETAGKCTEIVGLVNQKVFAGLHTIPLRPNQSFSKGFLGFYMNSIAFRDQLKSLMQGIKVLSISKKALKETVISFPHDLREQEKIGQHLSNIDTLIALHQRMLDEYKTLKKTMLSKMFPKNSEKYPELRFSGFTDAWELRKLGLLASFTKGNGYSKKDLVQDSNQTPIILYGSLYTNYKTNIEKVDTFARVKDKTIYSSGNDVVVPASGESAEDISRASAILKKGIILGGDLNIIHPLPDLNAIFLAITISNGTQKRELSRRAQGKSVVHLRNQDLKQVNLLYPNLEEQQKIGSFFKHLDSLITLHQRELELLKTLKKTMLQQMFV